MPVSKSGEIGGTGEGGWVSEGWGKGERGRGKD